VASPRSTSCARAGCWSAGAGVVEPVFSSSSSSWLATSRARKRAEPKKTTVSWMRSRRKRTIGSWYSAIMRITRPSGELRNSGFSYASGAG
jgi:hypothetical protein